MTVPPVAATNCGFTPLVVSSDSFTTNQPFVLSAKINVFDVPLVEKDGFKSPAPPIFDPLSATVNAFVAKL